MKRSATALLATLGVATVVAAAAPAQATPPSPPTSRPMVRVPGAAVRGNTVYSGNWAGYAATGQTFTAVSSTWVVPRTTCRDASYDVFWVGLDGYASGTVEQDGTLAGCSGAGANPVYRSWWEMYPTNNVTSDFAVTPGDRVTSTVTYSGGTFVLEVVDATNGHSFTKNERCASNLTCKRSSAEWITEAPASSTARLDLAPFSTITFGSSTATAASRKPISGWTHVKITMKQNAVDATASALSGGGSVFKAVWHNER